MHTCAPVTRIPVNKECLDNTLGPDDMEATGLEVTSPGPVRAAASVFSTSVVEDVTLSQEASTYVAHESETEVEAEEVNATVATAATIGAPVDSAQAAPVVSVVWKEGPEAMNLDKCTVHHGSTKRNIDEQAVCDAESLTLLSHDEPQL